MIGGILNADRFAFSSTICYIALHMVHRVFWINRIEKAWKKRSIIWLSGVRRAGKTYLCKSLPDIEYFDCELPRVRRMVEDPESFLEEYRKRRIVLDEIHRLDNPSQLLKIASDYYPDINIIATGSSTLGASAKFKDTLAGRKIEIWLTPIMSQDMRDFKNPDLMFRFIHGGLPPFFMEAKIPESEFQEWIEAYWAKDILDLFRLERRHSFQKFVEMLMIQRGGIFEATSFSRACEVSRSTISNYLNVLELTFVMHIVRPFSTRRAVEIISAPKVYSFDTGFICYQQAWQKLHSKDIGIMWEHFVLNELHAQLQSREIFYWRDKRGHEVDFILSQQGSDLVAIECKWSANEFEPSNLQAFWRQYPNSKIFVVGNDVERSYSRKYNGMTVRFVNLAALIEAIVNHGK